MEVVVVVVCVRMVHVCVCVEVVAAVMCARACGSGVCVGGEEDRERERESGAESMMGTGEGHVECSECAVLQSST